MFDNKYAYKLKFIGVAITAIFLVLSSRLVYLQVVQGDFYKRKADGNRLRVTPIFATRGQFYDRNGKVLVSNKAAFVVTISANKNNIDKASIEQLGKILNMPAADIIEKIERHVDANRVVLKVDVPAETVTLLEERKREFPNVFIETQPTREYRYNEFAVHALGYVAEISESEYERRKDDPNYLNNSIVGKMGIESFFDKEIRGKDGANQVEVNVAGKLVEQLGRVNPKPGNNLQLTIDYNIQLAAETILDKHLNYLRTTGLAPNAHSAALVVMDPTNGQILAMVSRPAFNPNLFVRGISYKDWNNINNNSYHPMTNKVISGEYPPGSSFKIITAITALSMDKVTPGEMYYDAGFHPAVPTMGNDGGKALGSINMKTALAKSDNVYFYEMSRRVGIEGLEKFSRNFGLGAPSGITLYGEAEGLVASPNYKLKVFDQDWYLGDTFNASIGQGYQLATPIQLANLMAMVANGGTRYKPYLVSRIFDDKNATLKEFKPEILSQIKLSAEDMSAVQLGLRGVAEVGGTAGELADFPVAIAGKTGTAENPHGLDHGVFVGYAPFENPKYVIALVVEQGGYSSISAVPIARGVFAAAFGIKE